MQAVSHLPRKLDLPDFGLLGCIVCISDLSIDLPLVPLFDHNSDLPPVQSLSQP